jgi:hypothetical protein
VRSVCKCVGGGGRICLFGMMDMGGLDADAAGETTTREKRGGTSHGTGKEKQRKGEKQ